MSGQRADLLPHEECTVPVPTSRSSPTNEECTLDSYSNTGLGLGLVTAKKRKDIDCPGSVVTKKGGSKKSRTHD